ncbi:TOG array regulator of axonemal microtubules protein 2-like isoform X1 [Trifolium pratense]|nr:TOG array regulator of axonemal microtubules protein 2-like isoform X1 [Trifolium pratense]
MALRPIDNALPTITQERPKKQPKIVVSTQKQQPRTSSNDENQVPSEPTIDYISSDNLKPMSDPEAQIQNLIGNLDSKNWVKVCESLNDVRRFALYNSSLLLPILDKILLVVVKSMKNPRSALCKTSIMAASDIFNAFGDKLFDPSTFEAFDGLLLQLLLKASQDKKFVCEEAEKALGSMVGSMTPLPLLLKLRVSVSHTNLRIRAKAAVSLSKCVSKMQGIEGMEEFGMEKLIEVAADLVNDRLPEAREAARSIATSVYEAIIKNVEEVEEKMEVWQSFCHSKLTPINALSILKIVKP